MSTPKKALLLIDLKNDYFPGGAFPLWNTDQTLSNILGTNARAKAQRHLVVHIQHIADPAMGLSPFFNKGTLGADIQKDVLDAAPDAPVVVKSFADSFVETSLDVTLSANGITDLLICGMMTQNFVTHTAISKSAEKNRTTILPDCCSTVSEMLHLIALHAVSTRMSLVPAKEALA